jgi:hypothetical protein
MDPVPPRQLQPKLPRDLEAICLKCLEKDPNHRYASAANLAEDLQRFLDGEPIRGRSITLLGQMVRTLGRSNVDAHFRTWSNWMLAIAPLPLLVYLIAYLVFREQEYYPYAMVAVSLTFTLVLIPTLFWGNRHSMRRVQRRQRNTLFSIWGGLLISYLLMPVVVWRLVPLRQPEDIFVVYPLWALLGAATLCSLGGEAGIFYLIAAYWYAAAGLMVWQPACSPFLIGLAITANALIEWIFLRRLQPPAGKT